MLAQKNITAVYDASNPDTYIQFDLADRNRSSVAAIATGPNVNGTAVFILMIESISGTFITIGLFDGIAQAAAASLIGANQYGWADIPGTMKVRVGRSDVTGGNGLVGFSVLTAGR